MTKLALKKSPQKTGKQVQKDIKKKEPEKTKNLCGEVDADFDIDEDGRYAATCTMFSRRDGYGFIQLSDEDVVPGNKVFVYRASLQSDDRLPYMYKGLEIETGLKKQTRQGTTTIVAKEVSLPGGGPINIQDESDAERKDFVGEQSSRYSGTIKFYDPIKKFGWITIDDGQVADDSVPNEVIVFGDECNFGRQRGQRIQNLAVEFGIYKPKEKDQYRGYNVTLPGGTAMSRDVLENRELGTKRMYEGTIQMWNIKQGWGFLETDVSKLPALAKTKLAEQTRKAKEKAEKRGKTCSDDQLIYLRRADLEIGTRVEKGQKCKFQIYTDDKGVGAHGVQFL